jgi:hypothetical protein
VSQSFALMCHNTFRYNFELDAVSLYQHGVFEEGEQNQYHGRICVNPAADEIMIVPERDGFCYVSDDAGATFNIRGQCAPVGVSNDHAVRCMRYHAEDDTWWVQHEAEPTYSFGMRYSEDAGVTWTSVTVSTLVILAYRTYSFNITPDGTAWLQGSEPTEQYAVAKDLTIKAGRDPSAGNRHIWPTLNGDHTYMASGLLDNNQYFISCQNYNSPDDRAVMVTANMATHKMWGASGTANSTPIGAANNIGIDQSGVLPYCLAWMSESSGVVTLNKLSWDAPHPIPTIVYDFGFDVIHSSIHYGNGKFALVALDPSINTKAYVVFMDPITFVWSPIYTITLPVATNSLISTSKTQLEYFKDGIWLFSYVYSTSIGKFILVKFTV